MNIPFVNLKRHFLHVHHELDQVMHELLESGQVMGGKPVLEFESAFSSFIGVKYGVACGNCTDALEIILRALEVGVGDEVIVPANGWISAAEVVLLLGAKPVFADPDPKFYTMDPAQVEKKISSKTKVIIPIHLYGLPAPMPEIMEIAKKNGLKVVEDCAQAHGARIGHQRVGSFGDAAAFSFYPTKNLGALGDGGMMLTNDRNLAEKIRMMANHGQKEKNEHVYLGRNSRLDAFQAAILQCMLPLLERWNGQRRKIARYYRESWQNLDLILPTSPENYEHIYHLYVIQVSRRDALASFLQKQGIVTEIHYPHAAPLMPVFRHLNHTERQFPIATGQAERLLSIPVYPELTDMEVEYIARQVEAGVKKSY